MRRILTHPASQLGSRSCTGYQSWRGGIAQFNQENWANFFVCDDQQPLAAGFDPADESEGAKLARLEAILLLVREPQNTRKLAQHANLADGTEARTLIRRLNERYDRVGRAFRVEQVAGGYQMLTRRKFASWLRRLGHVPLELRLSAPALETLAVIAYRQPTSRAAIEAIRGVNCGEIVRQLLERDLVRIGGRSEELGRPYLYCTTRKFLQTFGLVSLEDLPRADLIRTSAISAAPPVFSFPAGDLLATSAPAEAAEEEPDENPEFEFIPED